MTARSDKDKSTEAIINKKDDDDSSTDDSSDDEEDTSEKVRVTFRLSNECQDDTLKVPSQPIAVPADITRKGLQAIINHLLDRKIENKVTTDDNDNDEDDDDEQLPALSFEFIVGSVKKQYQRLLRTGVEREARRNGLSLEEAIPVIYFPAQDIPEKQGESEPLPDWIDSMSYDQDNNILITGCYDGSIHIYHENNENGGNLKKVSTPKVAKSGPIKCISTASNDENIYIASGSLDHSLTIYEVDPDTHKLKLYANCNDGHRSAIGCVDLVVSSSSSTSDKKLLASADWDGGLCIWDLSKQTIPDVTMDDVINDVQASKKAKTSNVTSTKNHQQTNPILSPIISIQAHASQISGVSWGNYEKYNNNLQNNNQFKQLITGSWDHSLKVWDIESQDCILTLNGSRVISCLDTSYHTSNVVATGHPDCTVRLWDTRATIKDSSAKESSLLQQVVSDNIFRPSHKAWISSVQWSRQNPYHLSSTSHDGTIKLWDIRSPLPLHTIKSFSNNTIDSTSSENSNKKIKHKGLSLAYGDMKNGMLFAGGTDCKIQQFQYIKPSP